MSNIFNLLSGLAEPNEGQIKPMERSLTSHEIRLNSLKNGGAKPKGLSIRSNSEMNISAINSIKKNKQENEQNGSKLKVTQLDNVGSPLSPKKLNSSKKLITQSSKLKETAFRDSTTNKCTKNQLSHDVFKKPLVPKKNIKTFPKPEKLAYWSDDQHNFDYGYIKTIEKEYKDLSFKEEKNQKSHQNNLLASESENLLDIPKIKFDDTCDEDLCPDIPNISDISDDEYLS
ncbi:hypothetical protein PUN28_015143 [Cardiocondyla obscurior]|uniref:Uncharacterized protein n=1 Tax=Cardiocondyla obscurior TaxID=286306 RepID=A0AAW2F0P9_9HYME